MAFEKLKIKLLGKKLLKEEKLRKERNKRLKINIRKKMRLQKEKEKLQKIEAELKKRIREAKKSGLSKKEREFLANREKVVKKKKEKLKKDIKGVAKTAGNILAAFADGVDRILAEEKKKPKRKTTKKNTVKKKPKRKTTKKNTVKKPKILKSSKKQTGKTNLSQDKKLSALAPGKRMSKNDKVYYEYRKNHSDVKDVDSPRTTRVKKH